MFPTQMSIINNAHLNNYSAIHIVGLLDQVVSNTNAQRDVSIISKETVLLHVVDDQPDGWDGANHHDNREENNVKPVPHLLHQLCILALHLTANQIENTSVNISFTFHISTSKPFILHVERKFQISIAFHLL